MNIKTNKNLPNIANAILVNVINGAFYKATIWARKVNPQTDRITEGFHFSTTGPLGQVNTFWCMRDYGAKLTYYKTFAGQRDINPSNIPKQYLNDKIANGTYKWGSVNISLDGSIWNASASFSAYPPQSSK